MAKDGVLVTLDDRVKRASKARKCALNGTPLLCCSVIEKMVLDAREGRTSGVIRVYHDNPR